jgi:capsular polysaccharide export protein
MITINSTSGLSAIFHGVPLLVVGNAFYANEKLATCARGTPDFDAFWKGGHVADEAFRHRYLDWVREMCLRPGDFYDHAGISEACEGILDLLKPTVAATEAARAA